MVFIRDIRLYTALFDAASLSVAVQLSEARLTVPEGWAAGGHSPKIYKIFATLHWLATGQPVRGPLKAERKKREHKRKISIRWHIFRVMSGAAGGECRQGIRILVHCVAL